VIEGANASSLVYGEVLKSYPSAINANTKRICFVATLPVTINAFVLPQAKYLELNGWDVTLICAEDKNISKVVPSGVRYIPMQFKRGIDIYGTPRAIFDLYRLFMREQFDIVQYTTPNAAFYASTSAWLARIPVRLYDLGGIRYEGYEGITRQFFKLLERWCCRCSTIIEPVSISSLEYSIQEGIFSRDKARIIWNGSACGVNVERFDIAKKEAWRAEYRNKVGIEPHHLVIGFVGSIRRDKGCNELIAASRNILSEMPDARLLLVGDKYFYGSIDMDLRDWIDSTNQVICIPPNSEIPQYMACMDILSLPSYREGFGLVIVEAEAMGVPVVVSDIPGPIDAMRHERTGLVVPVKNVEALTKALKLLLSDSTKRASYGAAAAAFARENYEQSEFLRHVMEDKEKLYSLHGRDYDS